MTSLIGVLLALSLAPSSAGPGPQETASSQEGVDEGWAALRSLEEKHRELAFLSARYVQERRTALMKKPLRSEGSLVFRREPGCLLFRTEKPRPTTMRLDSTTYQIHRPHKQQLEKFQLDDQRWQKALFQTLSHQIREIEKDFEVLGSSVVDAEDEEKAARRVRLRPRDAETRKRVRSLEIDVRIADSLVTRISYIDGKNDEIAILLSKLDVKTPLKPEAFVLEVPEGTKVIVHEDGGPRP